MGKVILILENDPKNLKLVTVILQVSGYATLQATDGKQGVELARKEKPDLILMDIRIPVMDGLEATKLLKNDGATRDIPVIALTAYAMKGDEEKMRAAGCDGYITKPIDIKGFLKKISEVISK
ncbi:MAG: response regulator [Deltaproteobacteria bacterium]|nr:response regulator [Deltaproteobacteria bacterium]